MNMERSEQVTAMAEAFARELSEWLSPEEWREVLARNGAERNDGICHSHDFCDANEVMFTAFAEVAGREPDVGDDDDAELWSAAWADAKARHLTGK